MSIDKKVFAITSLTILAPSYVIYYVMKFVMSDPTAPTIACGLISAIFAFQNLPNLYEHFRNKNAKKDNAKSI